MEFETIIVVAILFIGVLYLNRDVIKSDWSSFPSSSDKEA